MVTLEPDSSEHVRRAAGGDVYSLGWLVDRYTPVLLAQAYYRMGSILRREVAPEDLVQEVWVIALGKLSQFDVTADHRVAALLKFLGSILVYRINKVLRDRIVARTADPDAIIDVHARGVVTSVIRRENVSSALAAIEALSEPEREILVLRVLEQRPAKEVAAHLGITESLVYTRQHRALQLLRERLSTTVFDDLAGPPA
jgi:RNA polymerase sigma factor (sigma-70 family)